MRKGGDERIGTSWRCCILDLGFLRPAHSPALHICTPPSHPHLSQRPIQRTGQPLNKTPRLKSNLGVERAAGGVAAARVAGALVEGGPVAPPRAVLQVFVRLVAPVIKGSPDLIGWWPECVSCGMCAMECVRLGVGIWG